VWFFTNRASYATPSGDLGASQIEITAEQSDALLSTRVATHTRATSTFAQSFW
jgi:hypothetical protein